VEQAHDLANTESLRTLVIESLDMLYQAQLSDRRTTMTTLGKIENENRRLVVDSQDLLDSQIYRNFKEELGGFENWDSHARTLVSGLAEDLLVQQRYSRRGSKTRNN
jgi:hypothetical protein